MVTVPLWILIIVCSSISLYFIIGGILTLKSKKMNWKYTFSAMRLIGARASPRGAPPELTDRGTLRMGVAFLFLGLLFPVSVAGLVLSFAIEKQVVHYFILPFIALFIITIIVLPSIILKRNP